MQEKSFDTGEVVLTYAEGPRNGPPVVLLHGIHGKWQGLQTLIPLVADRWQVYALDLRGHGRSSHAAGRYHLLDFAGDIGAFLRHLAEPAVLIGHSLGAAIAVATAAEYPEFSRAVVLIDPPIRNGRLGEARDYPTIAERLHWVYDTIRESSSSSAILARLREINPEAPVEPLADYADQLSRLDPDVIQAVFEATLDSGYGLAEALRKIGCPLLLLYGDVNAGAVTRDEDAAFICNCHTSAVSAKVENGGHMFFAEQPEVVKKHLDAFLESV